MIVFEQTIPILRIFDVAKAKEFYIDFLGFTIEFEHRFEPSMPLYMGIERKGMKLHLSEHYGDGTPGSVVLVLMRGIEEFHAELAAKKYNYLRPGIEDQRPDLPFRVVNIVDPFGNRIRFAQDDDA